MKRLILLLVVAAFVIGGAYALPAALSMANSSGLKALARGDAEGAARTFRVLSWLGYADGKNNYAVTLLSGPGAVRDSDTAKELLGELASRGHLVAGYNLARLAESRHDTPMEDVAATLALLEPAVAVGDPHAAGEMADALFYRNRETLVPDLMNRRLELRRKAASNGDPVYLYRLARTLWDQFRETDNLDLALEAVASMQRAAEAGEHRAMLHMGNMEQQSPGKLKDAFAPEGFPGGDRFDWWARGAEAGSIAAACRYGVNFFRSVSRRETALPQYSGPPPKLNGRTEAGIRYLQACADATRVRGKQNPNFGEPALYYGRPLGGYSKDRSSRAHAKHTMALLLLEGRLLPRDKQRALAYLEAAAVDLDIAKTLLATLRG